MIVESCLILVNYHLFLFYIPKYKLVHLQVFLFFHDTIFLNHQNLGNIGHRSYLNLFYFFYDARKCHYQFACWPNIFVFVSSLFIFIINHTLRPGWTRFGFINPYISYLKLLKYVGTQTKAGDKDWFIQFLNIQTILIIFMLKVNHLIVRASILDRDLQITKLKLKINWK